MRVIKKLLLEALGPRFVERQFMRSQRVPQWSEGGLGLSDAHARLEPGNHDEPE
jgi:hypothetical protein